VFKDLETFAPVEIENTVKREVKSEAEDSTNTVKQEKLIASTNSNQCIETEYL